MTGVDTTRIRRADQPGDLGWVVMAHGEIYAQEFGWNTEFEALVARIVSDFANDPPPGPSAAWIAEVAGRRAGCVFCVPDEEPGVAKLRILLVAPDGRGQGLGRRLVQTALTFAAQAGYHRMRLWTNHPLTAAHHIYLGLGFALVAEHPHHSFGVDLVGQTYERALGTPRPPG